MRDLVEAVSRFPTVRRRLNGKHMWFLQYHDGFWIFVVELGKFAFTLEHSGHKRGEH